MEISPLVSLLVAAGLGLVVGLEREWAGTPIAGIRTFPLITLLGALTATLAERFGGWMVPAGLLALGILLAVAEWAESVTLRGKDETVAGITTTVAVLVMFAVGAALQAGFVTEAVVLSGVVSVLLHAKRPLHGLVDRIGEDDARAVFRFVLIALVILPLLPDRTFDPYRVLNPFKIWLMVVLIVGISLAAYVASKILGRRGGLVATGLLGGLISSTATTVSHARASRRSPKTADGAAFVILLSSTVVFARVLIEIAVVAPAMLRVTGPPLLAVLILMAVLAAVSYRKLVQDAELPGASEPPGELNTAITFGALYALVLLAVAMTKEHFGDRALFLVAGLSGTTDMDAITLSTAELVKGERLAPALGWRLILVGAMANLVFKAGVVAALGDRRLRSRIAVLFGLALAGSALVLWLWPS